MKTRALRGTSAIRWASTLVSGVLLGGCGMPAGEGGASTVVAAEGIASVRIPAGSLADPDEVTIRTTAEPETDEAFWNTGSLYNVNDRASFEVRINTGSSRPSQPLEAEIVIPDEFIQGMSPDSHLNLFAQVLFENENEIHDILEPLARSITIVDGVASVTLPTDVFNKRDSSETFEAVVIIGSWTEETVVLKSAVAAQSASVACVPLISPTDSKVTSDFGPRDQPCTGCSTDHKGIDLRAADGADVLSAAGGKVVWVGTGSKISTSLGNNVIVEHTVTRADGTVRKDRTRYSHLKTVSVSVGETVVAGSAIATADNTGTSQAAHLHFEYYQGGNFTAGEMGTKIDPLPCLDAGCGEGKKLDKETGVCLAPDPTGETGGVDFRDRDPSEADARPSSQPIDSRNADRPILP